MAYTAYSPLGLTPMFAESTNLITWQRIGPLIKGEDNKDHVIFHQQPPAIWITCSDDLQYWEEFQTVMGPRTEGWDCNRVGGGGVPIEFRGCCDTCGCR